MKIKETNTRTGEYHIYDPEDRKKEIELNKQNHFIGYHCEFKDMENGDIITTSEQDLWVKCF
jgi:hypothetical protein